MSDFFTRFATEASQDVVLDSASGDRALRGHRSHRRTGPKRRTTVNTIKALTATGFHCFTIAVGERVW
jgi:hypothetical protein